MQGIFSITSAREHRGKTAENIARYPFNKAFLNKAGHGVGADSFVLNPTACSSASEVIEPEEFEESEESAVSHNAYPHLSGGLLSAW